MIRFDRHTWISMASLTLMLLVLVVLAVLQYRWIGELSQAEQARLRWALDNAVNQFRFEFNSELRHIGAAFQTPPSFSDDSLRQLLAERYGDWHSEDHSTGLLAALYLRMKPKEGDPFLLRFNARNGAWEPAPWPGGFEGIRTLAINVTTESGNLPPRLFGWRVLPGVPALVRFVRRAEGGGGDSDLVVLQLDPGYLRDELLPSLTRKHFGARENPVFDVAVTFAGENKTSIYSSAPGSATDWFRRPDSRSPLVGDRPEPSPPMTEARDGRRSEGRPPGPPMPLRLEPAAVISRSIWRASGMLISEGRDWDLLARYRVGSLEEAVRISRFRNLALGFGVLLLLAAGMSLLLIAARRAQRLAQLQVRFVAGVSHDLRTPLAVINSAADNLAVGAVEDAGPRARQYGSLIRGECQKLASMVEEVLDYAGQRGLVRSLALEPVDAEGIILEALAEASPLLKAERFEVETTIPPDLPPVVANRTAFLQVLRNILENATRHAAAARWVGIGAGTAWAEGKQFVEVRVEDRGPGIESVDLPHVFKPFYRGRNAQKAGTRGSGLGLHLAHERVVAMGGSIHAESASHGGTAFVVRLLANVAGESPSTGNGKEEGKV